MVPTNTSQIDPSNLNYWNALGGADLKLRNLSKPLSSALPTSMQLSAGNGNTRSSTIGFSNVGFWGFPVVSSWEYKGSFYVYGSLDTNITVCLTSLSNEAYAEAHVEVKSTSSEWTQYHYTFQPTIDAPNSNATLNFTFPVSDLSSPVNFNLLSLFPPTYKSRENGLRVDLMEAMSDLKPKFFRAPGGNNVEGNSAPYWWNWTETIGPLTNRPGFPGTWGYENTNGLGLIEYMLWAEDLKMEPVLAVWSGFWLSGQAVPEDELKTYVNSALDELEFLMGDVSTKWGAYRESLGYGPFQINFVEVGNEDSLNGGAPTYAAYRFNAFYDAIKAAYPHMTIIASFYDVDGATPPFDAAGDFHEYAIPNQMAKQFGKFDNYTSEHPLLLGEYAVIEYNQPHTTGPQWTPGAPRAFTPFWYGSCAEAIFLLGAERNSDKIIGASYAPGFQNFNRWEWIPDLIEFDAYPGHTTLSTSYHMIKLLAGTLITENLPMTISDGGFGPAFFVAGRNSVTGSHIVKAVNYNSTGSTQFSFSFEGVGKGATGNLTYLTAPMNASNPIGGNVVQSHGSSVTASHDGVFHFKLPEYSIAVLEIGAESAGEGYNYSDPGKRQGWKGWKSWGGPLGHHGN
ncbi:hypothetical protein DPSP01_013320 [Paraphaeosphaeria sporulosa]